eukprot:6238870-Amphidinium_carterae.2
MAKMTSARSVPANVLSARVEMEPSKENGAKPPMDEVTIHNHWTETLHLALYRRAPPPSPPHGQSIVVGNNACFERSGRKLTLSLRVIVAPIASAGWDNFFIVLRDPVTKSNTLIKITRRQCRLPMVFLWIFGVSKSNYLHTVKHLHCAHESAHQRLPYVTVVTISSQRVPETLART